MGRELLLMKFERSEGAAAPRHPRQQDVRRTSPQLGRPTEA